MGRDDFAIVGIGASAGGLEAFSELLRHLRPDTGMAFILVQHLDPRHESILAELLSSKTSMPVLQVSRDTAVEPDHVYIIPPNSTITIRNRTLSLQPRSASLDRYKPIDTFLISLAADIHSSAVGVVLSGTASDGTLGLKAIRQENGITFAQDATAKFDSMPRSAIAAGVVDFVLPPRRIAEELGSIAAHPPRIDIPPSGAIEPGPALHRLLSLLRESSGVDFSQYRQATVSRRLMRRMALRGVAEIEQYLEIIQNDPAEATALFNDLLINVTEFFRDSRVFETAQRAVFPDLIGDRAESDPIRVWVPGCSSGEEVYSIAIALREFLEETNAGASLQIFGTDISEGAIGRARAGIYNESELASVSRTRLERFFTSVDSGFQIRRQIREMCIFSRHNIAKDPPLSRMDLISCRNLLIYFSPTLQKRVISTLGHALRPRGYLILGSSESLGSVTQVFIAVNEEHRIYRRRSDAARSASGTPGRIAKYRREPVDASPGHPTGPSPAGKPASAAERFLARSPVFAAQDAITAANATSDKTVNLEEPMAPQNQLQEELASTRQYLQSIIEELRASNEEAQSANEELQSANEELQTAKEELQSSNEELNTMNAEMQSRNFELAQVNDDLTNLLSSMNMPIVMLSGDLRIRRFTPMAAKVFHIIAADAGRPISDLKPRIHVPDLENILRNVLDTLVPEEREVRDLEGRWYLMRIRPYRTTDNRIDGAVLQLLDVGELKRSLEEVKRARDYAQAIVDTVREPLVVLNRQFRIQNANSSFYEFADMPAAAAIGRSIFEIAQRSLDSRRIRELLEQLVERGTQLSDIEFEHERDGEKHVMLLNARYLRDGQNSELILLAFEEISAREREAEARYRALFESAKDGILILEAATGEITDMNPFIEQLLGYTRDQLMGQKVWEIEPLEDRQRMRAAFDQIGEQGVLTLSNLSLRTKDGRSLQTEVIANLYGDKEHRAIQLNIRDLTERKKFELELRHTQKLESLGLMAGGIAHDFNNLLTGILGNASLAWAETAADLPARKYIREVVNATERASFLTRQLLAYAGKGQFAMEAIDLGELVREISTMIGTSIPKTVELRLNPGANLPPIEADPGQIQQVVMNLVINAAESVGEGRTGRVEISTELVEISAQDVRTHYATSALKPGPHIRLEVKDNGCGMDEATKARIFDPFFTTKFTGRGLGLAAVQGIVNGHKGAIRVFSTPGHGTSFQILLPASRSTTVATPDKPSNGGQFEGFALIVDDEEVVRNVAAAILSRHGFEALTAGNGKVAIDIFREHQDQIRLVLLDLLMPVMGGEEALEQIQAMRPDVPILISSGFDANEADRRFAGRNLAGFVQKPYGASRLIEAVRTALKKFEGSEAGRK